MTTSKEDIIAKDSYIMDAMRFVFNPSTQEAEASRSLRVWGLVYIDPVSTAPPHTYTSKEEKT